MPIKAIKESRQKTDELQQQPEVWREWKPDTPKRSNDHLQGRRRRGAGPGPTVLPRAFGLTCALRLCYRSPCIGNYSLVPAPLPDLAMAIRNGSAPIYPHRGAAWTRGPDRSVFK